MWDPGEDTAAGPATKFGISRAPDTSMPKHNMLQQWSSVRESLPRANPRHQAQCAKLCCTPPVLMCEAGTTGLPTAMSMPPLNVRFSIMQSSGFARGGNRPPLNIQREVVGPGSYSIGSIRLSAALQTNIWSKEGRGHNKGRHPCDSLQCTSCPSCGIHC